MIRGLLAGRKTQTRRLATSPLRRCAVDDRLYVREAWLTWGIFDDLKPSLLNGREGITYLADVTHSDPLPGRKRPGMHMPRWASRATLIVEGVKVEPLQAISSSDARAEGIERENGEWKEYTGRPILPLGPRECFASLWASLHDKHGERWQDNPDVVALTFRVERGNIDRLPA